MADTVHQFVSLHRDLSRRLADNLSSRELSDQGAATLQQAVHALPNVTRSQGRWRLDLERSQVAMGWR